MCGARVHRLARVVRRRPRRSRTHRATWRCQRSPSALRPPLGDGQQCRRPCGARLIAAGHSGTFYGRGMVSEIFDADAWDEVPGFELQDITYHRAKAHGTVRVAFDRPEVRNAFRPSTVDELYRVLDHARQSS